MSFFIFIWRFPHIGQDYLYMYYNKHENHNQGLKNESKFTKDESCYDSMVFFSYNAYVLPHTCMHALDVLNYRYFRLP